MKKGILKNILQKVGRTPLVRINRLSDGKAEIVAKVEYFNPGGSTKDRIALEMIEEAEKSGRLSPGCLIVEPTSGNTGIGLALVAVIKKYRLILTMPETMSIERRKLLAIYGAEIELTPGDQGMNGSIARAKQIVEENPGAFMPSQFDNPANPMAHRRTTGKEIWQDTNGELDVFVATVGTGGTLTGTAQYLKERNPNIRIVAVEPAESPVLSGGQPGPHKIQGIGAGFVPKVLSREIIDEVLPVRSDDAIQMARNAASQEGLLVGLSSGAALYAAVELSKRPELEGKRIVVLLPDTGERYLSTELIS